MPRKRIIDGMPTNIFDYMTESHIEHVWQELALRFGFNVKAWKEQFESQFNRQPHSVSKESFFFRWGNEHLQPIINGILCRPNYHGTFNKLVEYVIRKRDHRIKKGT